MQPNQETWSPSTPIEGHDRALPQTASSEEPRIRLNRWLASYASGAEWYAVGEFVAADATSAIERAVEIFGSGAAYRAEEIPWDAAPLHQANRTPRTGGRGRDSLVVRPEQAGVDWNRDLQQG
jgi:hypothetical protein